MDNEVIAIIPAYQPPPALVGVVASLRRQGYPVLIVDDGSDEAARKVIAETGAEVLRIPANRGKGFALRVGFQRALNSGFRAVVTIDADGQHDPAQINLFVDAWRAGAGDVVVGSRMHTKEKIPWLRRQTNRFMTWFLSKRAGQELYDSQSGYRLVAADVLRTVALICDHYETESELLYKAARHGFRITSVPIATIYTEEHKSFIRPFRDALRWLWFLLRMQLT